MPVYFRRRLPSAERAKLWASVFPNITPQPKLVVADEGDLALAMRKNNPELKATGG